MFLAPVTAFTIGLFLGFIKGFQWLKISLKSVLATLLVISVPFIYNIISGGDRDIPFIVAAAISITYLSLIAGTLAGGLIGKLAGRKAV